MVIDPVHVDQRKNIKSVVMNLNYKQMKKYNKQNQIEIFYFFIFVNNNLIIK